MPPIFVLTVLYGAISILRYGTSIKSFAVHRATTRINSNRMVHSYALLYDEDGQHASELARAVGRAATSFTPNLDKLQDKALIERRPDPGDRRAVRIYLTDAGQ